jgi:probable HAF family extracellular repeat protein
MLAVIGCHGEQALTSPDATAISTPGAIASPSQYEAIDLGPFSGLAVDKHETVYGTRNATDGNHVVHWADGSLADLGALPSDGLNTWMTASGLAAGILRECADCYAARAFYVWDAGSVRTLEFGAPSESATLRGLTDEGLAIATVDDRGMFWRDAVGSVIAPTSAGNTVTPNAVNSKGTVVGSSGHPFIWDERNGTRDLGLIAEGACAPDSACGSGYAQDVNELDDVVGISTDANGMSHTVLWRHGTTAQDLGAIGSPMFINDRGQVLLSVSRGLALWDNGSLQPLPGLGAPGGGSDNTARALGENGEVVGTGRTANFRRQAFVWRDGAMTNLGALVNAFFSAPLGINKHGDIVGVYTTQSFESRAVLWRRLERPAVAAR